MLQDKETRRTNDIRYMEEISLNAWPSHMIELYDGWLIRFSHNYTYRTNSVEQVGPSTIPVDEKIRYCEDVYAGLGSPCSFKINPLLDPSFDATLEARGYAVRHVTQVMTADLSKISIGEPSSVEFEFENRTGLPSAVTWEDCCVQLQSDITDEWISGLFHLNGTTNPTLRRIVPYMYYAIPKETIAARVECEGRMVASGLGIRDRDYIGIYAIYVSPGCRRRHYARAICSTLLREARRTGAQHAYLQVVQGNAAARSLYQSLGFEDFYTYWFRSRSV